MRITLRIDVGAESRLQCHQIESLKVNGELFMEEGKADLKVYMLGKLSMVYGGPPVTFKRNSATKVLKLLQILLHYSAARGGISRSQLL